MTPTVLNQKQANQNKKIVSEGGIESTCTDAHCVTKLLVFRKEKMGIFFISSLRFSYNNAVSTSSVIIYEFLLQWVVVWDFLPTLSSLSPILHFGLKTQVLQLELLHRFSLRQEHLVISESFVGHFLHTVPIEALQGFTAYSPVKLIILVEKSSALKQAVSKQQP